MAGIGKQGARRCALYGAGMAIVLTLCVLPSVLQGEPDINSLLSGAKLLTQVGAHDQAIVDCRRVLERDPTNVQGRLLLALASDRLGEHDQAVAEYEQVLQSRISEKQQLQIRLAIADLHLRNEKPSRASMVCEEIIGLFPESAKAYLVRGLAEMASGQNGRALESLRKSKQLDPSDEYVAELLEGLSDGDGCVAP